MVASFAFIAVFVAVYMRGAPPVVEAARPPVVRKTEAASPAANAAARISQSPVRRQAASGLAGSGSSIRHRVFTICHTGGGIDCVVDGDTAWIAGEKIRVADIDAPETHPPRCAYEAELGDRATRRLAELMNEGAFELRVMDRDVDRYGRKLRVVVRKGRSLGDILVAEGLARTWEGRRRPWC